MVAVMRSAVLSPANPLLHTFTAAAGVLVDPVSLVFQIFDAHDRAAVPTQVFPVTVGTTQSVNLVTARLGPGHFAATWTVPSMEALGRHRIRWTATITATGPGDDDPTTIAVQWEEDFEVLLVVSGENGASSYALVSDLRDEGLAAATAPDWKVLDALAAASRRIRQWLGRDFAPTYGRFTLDDRGSSMIILEQPIIALESLGFDASGTTVELDTLRVYNRHITQRLVNPDDRKAPAIDLLGRDFFTIDALGGVEMIPARRTRRSQNVIVTGLFGYTDPDGSPTGRTPLDIRRATMLIANRDVLPIGSQKAWEAINMGKVRAMRTREQSITFGENSASSGSFVVSPFTGDPTIDGLLVPYIAPVSCSVP